MANALRTLKLYGCVLAGRIEAGAERVLYRRREIQARLGHCIRSSRLLLVLTTPAIYMLIVPLCLLDLCVTLYQAVCFPVYRIRKVRRADYVVFDRAELQYLNALEKLNCAYCSYANGLLGYVREIAARTEQYWCPIKHGQRVLNAHGRYRDFLEYGDAEGYRYELARLRRQLQEPAKLEGPRTVAGPVGSRGHHAES